MGSLTTHVKALERDAYTQALRRECHCVAILFGVDPAEVEAEALWLLRNPQQLGFTAEQIEGEREIMYAVARKRGVPLDEVKADIDAVISGLLALT